MDQKGNALPFTYAEMKSDDSTVIYMKCILDPSKFTLNTDWRATGSTRSSKKPAPTIIMSMNDLPLSYPEIQYFENRFYLEDDEGRQYGVLTLHNNTATLKAHTASNHIWGV